MATAFVCALRCDTGAAPWLFDGPPQPLAMVAPPMNGGCLLAYAEHFPAPALGEGDAVVMDSLPAGKGAGVRQAIARTGATLRDLPPYSPDFNPIGPSAGSSFGRSYGAGGEDVAPSSLDAVDGVAPWPELMA